MPDVSSADASIGVATSPPVRALGLSPGARLAMVALGFIPLLHVLATALPIVAAARGYLSWAAGIAGAAAVLYLVPPLAVLSTWRGAHPPPRNGLGSRTFLRWWFSAQWQLVFNRLPWLEECLRLVPGLYSTWLRLFGARIGGLVYWSPGVAILDRQWLRIGSRVVLGTGVRLNGHVIARHRQKEAALYLGTVTVGSDALIGAYSLLLPGCTVAAGETTPPLRTIHAFARWERGRPATTTDEGLAEAGG